MRLFPVLIFVLIEINFESALAAAQQQNVYSNGDYYDAEDADFAPVSPCNVVRPGDPDITIYDVISAYRFDGYQYESQGVYEISGSTAYQTAYHIEEYSNMTIEATQAFPKGVPNEFSFECTFRVPEMQPQEEWFLFELTDYRYESQMSVTINPIYYTVDFSLPKYDGTIQTITFEETEIFDRSWHKLMISATQDSVRLWVDCQPVADRTGSVLVPLDVRGPIDATDGAFSVARNCRTRNSVPIDLQWMIFSCDVDKPEHTTCEDIPYTIRKPPPDIEIVDTTTNAVDTTTTKPPLDLSFLTTSTEYPWFFSSTPSALSGNELHTCPEVCPRGPPGPPGPPGAQGIMGIPGVAVHHAFGELQQAREELKGETGDVGAPGMKGEQGERGLTGLKGEPGIPGLPGIQGPPGFVLERNDSTTTGSIMVAGPPGPAGAKGEPGEPGTVGPAGLRGFDGNPGQPGPQGFTGQSGLPGPPGSPGYSGAVYNEQRNIEEREIREICMAVVREYLTEISSSFAGPPGPPGPPGRRGTGRTGPQGIQGEQGPRGQQGERGYPGMPGAPGPQGDIGPRGSDGERGERGEDGVGREGLMGPPGPQGPPGHGMDGMPGRPGDRGDIGQPGEPGIRGAAGDPGICPDCAAYQAAYAYPLLLAQQQQNNKGPPSYSNKGPVNYYNKGPPDYNNKG